MHVFVVCVCVRACVRACVRLPKSVYVYYVLMLRSAESNPADIYIYRGARVGGRGRCVRTYVRVCL